MLLIRWSCCKTKGLVTTLALSAYMLLAFGVPIPQLSKGQAGEDEPYPCQHHQCGCTSAEQCWEQCCCFSAQQKLDWAVAHNVSPPAQLVAAIQQQAAADRAKDSFRATKEARSCCTHRHDTVESGGRSEKPSSSQARIKFVMGVQALECQGSGTIWLTMGAVSVPPQVASTLDEHTGTWLPGLIDLSSSGTLMPPVPPPPQWV